MSELWWCIEYLTLFIFLFIYRWDHINDLCFEWFEDWMGNKCWKISNQTSLNSLNLSIFLLLHFLGLRLWDFSVKVDLFCGDLKTLWGSYGSSSILSSWRLRADYFLRNMVILSYCYILKDLSLLSSKLSVVRGSSLNSSLELE